MRQLALVSGIEMDDDDVSRAEICREIGEQGPQRIYAARRRAYADDRQARPLSCVILVTELGHASRFLEPELAILGRKIQSQVIKSQVIKSQVIKGQVIDCGATVARSVRINLN